MLIQLFSNFLVEKNLISESDLNKILYAKRTDKLPLGYLALSQGLLTPDQMDEVNQIQSTTDKRFGDIAVEKGYFTQEQLVGLLKLQSKDDLVLEKIFSDLQIMPLIEIQEYLTEFKTAFNLSESDYKNIVNNDVRTCIAKVGEVSSEDTFFEFCICFVNMIVRFIDRDVIIHKSYFEEEMTLKARIAQSCVGRDELITGYTADTESLIKIAERYAGAKFSDYALDEDSTDALVEFLNCVCGIFIGMIEKEKSLDYDLVVPSFSENVTMNKVCVLPVTTNLGTIYITYKAV